MSDVAPNAALPPDCAPPPTADMVRQQFIDFFVQQAGHTFAPGSPVIPPPDERTLLFTNAGMNQFKDVFLGAGTRPYSRAVNSQACIRASGKHNDLEDVGRSRRHHTLFEMLGNWSFGDYFKQEAIQWAWTLLTQVWGLPKDRLYATVYKGDPAAGIPADEDAAELWRRCTDIDPSHILFFDECFWAAGDVGPCGPCSEIHIDRSPGGGQAPSETEDRPFVTEIWNLVFMQYSRGADGRLTMLPSRSVDTGMGLERIVSVLQGRADNYATDLFTPLIRAIESLTGIRYGGSWPDSAAGTSAEQVGRDVAIRAIADHMRCLVFALSDGAGIGNKGRDAVLKSILRRASRFAYQRLGQDEPVLHRLVPAVVQAQGHFFASLRKRPDEVAEAIRLEEEQFLRTLSRGIAHFEQAVAGMPSEARQMDGRTVFDLMTTFGFPVDLTRQMAGERGLSVDEAGFEAAMAEHARVSRGEGEKFAGSEALALSAQAYERLIALGVEPTETAVKYSVSAGEVCMARAVAMLVGGVPVEQLNESMAGKTVVVILDRSPFYVESGGQVGDRGRIERGGLCVEVSRVAASHGYVLHEGILRTADAGDLLMTADTVDAVVWEERSAIAAHHTATHLAHWALHEVFGEKVQQRGSQVAPDGLRFDFDLDASPGLESLTRVEQLVNAHIAADEPVRSFEMSQDAARETFGARLRAFFGDKYGDTVRVVTIADGCAGPVPPSDNASPSQAYAEATYSVEFCGGTHARRTGELGRFRIVGETAISKGVRRIEAVVGDLATQAEEAGNALHLRYRELLDADGPTLAERLPELSQEVDTAAIPLTTKRALREQLRALQEKLREYLKDRGRLQAASLLEQLEARLDKADRLSGVAVLTVDLGEASADAVKSAGEKLRKSGGELAAMLAWREWGQKAGLLALCSPAAVARGLKAGDWLRLTAGVIGGKGGGRPDSAQGGGPDVGRLAEALKQAGTEAAARLG